MTVLFCSNTGKKITLINQIASSGEGTVWNTDWSGYLAKVYHSPHHERVNKLEVMVTHPPKEPNSHLNHFSFAWPKSLLKDSNGWVLGFLMPAITGGVELIDVYNPQRRQLLGLEINWYFLHATAMNIASIIQALHVEGYVLGDIKSQNILVNNRALPSIIDTDSFQVRHPNTGEIYRCLVGSEGFTPVELMGKDFHITDQTEVHDRFRLAVIIYHLLFGNHPFQGRWKGTEDSPDINQLICQGFWPYAPNSLIQLSPLTIPLNIVHPEIQQCFKRCFNDGHTRPNLRPTAGEWVKALDVAFSDLTPCTQMTNHFHSLSYGKCYWCERASKLGVDIFPGATIQQPQPAVTEPQSKSSVAAQISPYKIFAADQVSELLQQKGQQVMVVGQVYGTRSHNNNKMLFINFLCNTFTVVIFQEGLNKLIKANKINMANLKSYQGKFLTITGIIENHQSNKKILFPQIVLQDPSQLEWITEIQAKKILVKSVNHPSSRSKSAKAANKTSIQVSTSTKAYYEQGMTHARQRNYHAAIKDYNEVIRSDPKYIHAYYNRGLAYEKIGDYQRAIKDYDKVLQLNHKYASAYYKRGLIREKLGDKQGAIDDFQEATYLGNQLAREKL